MASENSTFGSAEDFKNVSISICIGIWDYISRLEKLGVELPEGKKPKT
jgi:hypothetical protein